MNCYVTNPRSNAEYPSELTKDNTLFYPESKMTTFQCFTTSRPRDFHIVTDCPFLVSLYDKKEVFIWKDDKWANPDFQTYGTSYSIIIDDIFEYGRSIPQAVIDGKTTNCMGYATK